MKKIAIVTSRNILTADSGNEIIRLAQEEVDRILNLEENERPPFGVVVIGCGSGGNINEAMRVSTELMHQAARMEVPIVVCSKEQQKEIEEIGVEKMSEALTTFRAREEMVLEVINYKLEIPRLPEPEFYIEDFNKKSFGGQKKGRNRKLRRQ